MRTWGHRLAAALLVLLGLSHLHLVVSVLIDPGSEPLLLFVGHLVCLTAALVAAVSCWGGLPWAWGAVAAYGLAGAVLSLSLGPVLVLPAGARTGLQPAAAVVLVLAGLGAWRLRRSARI